MSAGRQSEVDFLHPLGSSLDETLGVNRPYKRTET